MQNKQKQQQSLPLFVKMPKLGKNNSFISNNNFLNKPQHSLDMLDVITVRGDNNEKTSPKSTLTNGKLKKSKSDTALPKKAKLKKSSSLSSITHSSKKSPKNGPKKLGKSVNRKHSIESNGPSKKKKKADVTNESEIISICGSSENGIETILETPVENNPRAILAEGKCKRNMKKSPSTQTDKSAKVMKKSSSPKTALVKPDKIRKLKENNVNTKRKKSFSASKSPCRFRGLVVKLGSFNKKAVDTVEIESVRSSTDSPSLSSRNSPSLSTSGSEGILYSLATSAEQSATSASSWDISSDEEPDPHKKLMLSKKKLVLKLTDLKHERGTSTEYSTPDSDPDSEITFKHSPRKLLLKDSIRPKYQRKASISVKPVASKLIRSAQSTTVAPSPGDSPLSTTNDHVEHELSPSLAKITDQPRMSPVIPYLPTSPSPPCYNTLVKTLSSHYLNNRGIKRELGLDVLKEPAERRVSVRHSESAFKYKEIIVKKFQHYTQIWLLSQTKRKNALNPKVFQELNMALHNAKFDDTRVVLLTGSGSVFCSGIDLHYLMADDRRLAVTQMLDSLRDFIKALISFPKPLVAAVNGPAVGLGVAILPLCDVIYASDKASFYCPYTKLGQTPEGCASYTFSHAMGLAMANELLMAGRKITALEAYQIGLVSQVFWPTSLMQEVIPRLQQMAGISAKALEATKALMRGHMQSKLQMTLETEGHMLAELWMSADYQHAIVEYAEQDEDMMSR